MPWLEFSQLLAGIDPDTTLGRVVSIRAEKDPEKISKFTEYERKIYNGWAGKRKTSAASLEERDRFLEELKNAFLSMSGSKGTKKP